MSGKLISFLKYLAKRFVDKLAGNVVDKSFYVLFALTALIAVAAVLTGACPPLPRPVMVRTDVSPTVSFAPQVNATLFQINVNSNNRTTSTFFINNPPSFQTAHVQTQDRCGKSLGIELGMLSDKYRWVYVSDSKVGISLKESVEIDEVFQHIPNTVSLPVIAVGLASHEHAEDDASSEIGRALRRVDNLVKAADTHFTVNRPELYSLNIGYYTGRSTLPSDESAIERRVILMQVTSREKDTDLNSGVRNALIKLKEEKKLVEGFDPDAYSEFPPEKFSVKPRSPNAHNEMVPCVQQPSNPPAQR